MSRPIFVIAVFLNLLGIAIAGNVAGDSAPASPIKVACVGDSITAGAGAPKGESYPNQLQQVLGKGWKVVNFGRSGTTMLRNGNRPYWKDKNFQKAQDFKPNVVVIMLGTNDSKPRNWVHESEFVSDYRDMVKIFQGLSSKPRIYLCRVPRVVEPNKYKISETASAIIRQRTDALAKDMGLTIIPMDQAYGGNLSVLEDNVHPNRQGALELAQTAARTLTATAVPSPIQATH